MSLITIIYLLPYIASFFISFGVALYAWQRRNVPGSGAFAVAAFGEALWTLGYIFELSNPDLSAKIFWDNLQWIAAFAVSLAWLAFAFDYTGLKPRRYKQLWQILLAVSAVALLLIFSDGWHGLIHPVIQLLPTELFLIMVYDFTPLLWLIAIYIYGLTLAGIFLLVIYFLKAQTLYRFQIAIVLLAFSVPAISQLLTLLDVFPTVTNDTTPISFALSNMVMAWGLYKYRLFDIAPVARDIILENIPDAIFVLDANSRLVDLNNTAQMMIGLKKSTAIGKLADEVFLQWRNLPPKFKNARQGRTELTIKGQKGLSYIEMRIVSLEESKRSAGKVIIARDITSEKRAEKIQSVLFNISQMAVASTNLYELLASIHGQLGQLLNATNFYVALYDPETALYSFPYWQDEYDKDEYLWQPRSLPKSYTDYVRRTGLALLADDKIHAQLSKEGEVKLIDSPSNQWLGIPLKTPNGTIGVAVLQNYHNPGLYSEQDAELLTIVSDTIALVIERKFSEEALVHYRNQLEELVEERTAELERRNRQLQNFTYISSHHLQEPLRKIQLFGSRLTDKYATQLDEPGYTYVQRMQNASARLQQLILGLTSLSGITSRDTSFETVNLNEVLQDVLAELSPEIEATNARLRATDLAVIEADLQQMRLLFYNLINNALKFCQPNLPPDIQIKGEALPPKDNCIHRYQISFHDKGIGFDEAYLDQIFDVFQRLHNPDSFDGTGIGLALCHRIVERHGGTLSARSKPGRGSTFTVILPITQSVS